MLTGRLIVDDPKSGSENMAIDTGLVESLLGNMGTPVFRLYQWKPWCLSLGHHQPISDVNPTYLQSKQYDLVRRPTGGRAVLHANELTYAVIVPLKNKSAKDWYDWVHQIFHQAMIHLGVETEYKFGNDHFKTIYQQYQSVPCFISSAESELLLAGKKVIGSAQRKYESVLLQHGSLILDDSHLDIVNALQFASVDDQKSMLDLLAEKSISLKTAGFELTFSQIASAIEWSLSQSDEVKFDRGDYSPEEMEVFYHFTKKFRRVS